MLRKRKAPKSLKDPPSFRSRSQTPAQAKEIGHLESGKSSYECLLETMSRNATSKLFKSDNGGSDDGEVEGSDDGEVEGSDDGEVEGSDDGEVDGSDDGEVEGSDDGEVEGSDDGEVDGSQNGEVDGKSKGDATESDYFTNHLDYQLSEEEIEKVKVQMESYQINQVQKVTDFGLVCCQEPEAEEGDLSVKLKSKLQKHWLPVTGGNDLTSLQNHLFGIISQYKDLYWTLREDKNCGEVRQVYLLHAMNHVLKAQSKVLRNNSRISQMSEEGKMLDDVSDQGFTRPKILILLPFRQSAYSVINLIIQLMFGDSSGHVTHKKKFVQEFTLQDKNNQSGSTKPESYRSMFEGNTDDCFRIGVAIGRKSVKLFSDLFSSDIIVASPLGLKLATESGSKKGASFDFLSSLEMVILDQTDVFLMQNWEHVTYLFSHFHQQPLDSHNMDISRLRPWIVNGRGKYYCQTLLFSSFATPELTSFFYKFCYNYNGKVANYRPLYEGTICQVAVQCSQIFQKISCDRSIEQFDRRFQFFVEKVIPRFQAPLMQGTVIFVPSYLDYIRIRNFMKRENLNFCHICEYTRGADIQRARIRFLQGNRHFLIITERFHFYNRYHLKGVRQLVFYQLPMYAEFYSELVNTMTCVGSSDLHLPSCHVLYTKFDEHRLSRTVGSTRANSLLQSTQPIHMLLSE